MSAITIGVPQQIQSNLSMGNSGAGLFQNAGSNSGLASNYAATYNDALSANLAQYKQTLGGYQTTMANQTTSQQAQMGGWNDLYNTIQGMLGLGAGGAVGAGGRVGAGTGAGGTGVPGGNWGIAAPAAQQIADTYAQNSGAAQQAMINAGMGAGTTAISAQRAPTLDAAKAYGSLGSMLAQTATGYASQIGQGRLNYANQANMQNSAEANKMLDFMAGVHIPYPNTAAYGSLYGANLQRQLGAAGRSGQAVVNPFGSSSAGSQGHIPFSAGQSMPSPPGAATQGYQPNTQGVINRGLSLGANTTASAASYGMSEGDYQNWVATGSPTDAQGNPTDSYGNPLNQSQVDQGMQPVGGFDQMFGQNAAAAYGGYAPGGGEGRFVGQDTSGYFGGGGGD